MTECIIRPATRGARGYPQINDRGRNVRLHRRYKEIQLGRKLAPTEEVIHLCHNKRCVNIDHLIVGSHAENMRMMAEAGRSARGERNGHAKLTADNVAMIRRYHRTGEYDWSFLGQLFGCTASNIKKIVRRQSWKHVA